jgi:hypothetical protein
MWIGMAADSTAIGENPTMPPLVEPQLERVLEFCAREPVERVFIEDVARRGLGRFLALEGDGGSLEALCHVGANLVPSGRGCDAFATAAVRSSSRMIIGEERAVGELWSAAAPLLEAPREDRPGQPVYVIAKPPAAGESGLRPAALDDLERLLPACANAHAEELGVQPLLRDPEGFRWRTRSQIEEGRSWLWLEDDVILFKAEASAWTPAAVQIQQVWVDPEVRGRGYAGRGCSGRCRSSLSSSGRTTRRRSRSTSRSGWSGP